MAFSSTLTSKRQLPGGMVLEEYVWTADGGTTTGNITANTTLQPEITKIGPCGASSDADNAALVWATDAGDTILKLTFNANDTGRAWIMGKGA